MTMKCCMNYRELIDRSSKDAFCSNINLIILLHCTFVFLFDHEGRNYSFSSQ